jgi:spermidine synthase
MPEIWKEDLCDYGVVRAHLARKQVVLTVTHRQIVDIADYANFGRGLMLGDPKDGIMWPQCSRNDSEQFHQAAVHPSMLFEENKDLSIGIFGGGECGAWNQYSIYPKDIVRRGTIFDWDPEFVAIAKKYLHCIHKGSWKDTDRLNFVFANVFEHLPELVRLGVVYDKIHGDLVDLASWKRFRPDVYKLIKKILRRNGTFTNQSGNGDETRREIRKFVGGLREAAEEFTYIWVYKTRNIPFFGYDQLFTVMTDNSSFNPLAKTKEEIDAKILQLFDKPLAQYSGAIHHGMFALSRRYKEEIRAAIGNKFPQYYLI